MVDTIIPTTFLPIALGVVTAGIGAYTETRYVSKLSILITVSNVLITLFFTDVNSIGFYIWAVYSVFGIIVIARDVRKHYKNSYVAFFLGSKTIGSITVFLGLTTNDLVMPYFQPIYTMFAELLGVEMLTGLGLQIVVHVIGVLIILFVVHLIGRIIGVLHKHHRFLF